MTALVDDWSASPRFGAIHCVVRSGFTLCEKNSEQRKNEKKDSKLSNDHSSGLCPSRSFQSKRYQPILPACFISLADLAKNAENKNFQKN